MGVLTEKFSDRKISGAVRVIQFFGREIFRSTEHYAKGVLDRKICWSVRQRVVVNQCQGWGHQSLKQLVDYIAMINRDNWSAGVIKKML